MCNTLHFLMREKYGDEGGEGREGCMGTDYMEFCAVAHRNAKLMKSHADKTGKKYKNDDDEVAQFRPEIRPGPRPQDRPRPRRSESQVNLDC